MNTYFPELEQDFNAICTNTKLESTTKIDELSKLKITVKEQICSVCCNIVSITFKPKLNELQDLLQRIKNEKHRLA